MPVMGPSYNKDFVQKVYVDVMNLLKEKYHIQNHQPMKKFNGKTYQEDREERNLKLEQALEGLIELDSWESF